MTLSEHCGVRLTPKQEAMLRVASQEERNAFWPGSPAYEGMVFELLWPQIRRPRLVLNSLVDRGLVRLVEWIDEEAGYSFTLTDEGREAINA